MTISPERIEAEIAAEVKRIEAWNNTLENAARGLRSPLTPIWIRELANDIVPKRLQVEEPTVICDGCGFRYGAEHTVASGNYECPVCAESRLGIQLAALLEAAKALLDARFTGGYCPWCGIAVRVELLTDPTDHYGECALRHAQAAVAAYEEKP